MTTRIITDSNGRKHITNEPLLHPPQRTWVGLTEDEIVLISADCAATHQHTDIHFARAIEAKLKQKNIEGIESKPCAKRKDLTAR
jgi:hypothetical protein